MSKSTVQFQNTLARPVEISGMGVHSGRYVEITIHPAPAYHGIKFNRTDVIDSNYIIPATVDHAVPHPLCTRIENCDGVGVNTIEHFMAAFHGMGIDNLLIEVDGPEMPILDGSSTLIIDLLSQAGLQEQSEAKQVFVMVGDVEIDLGNGRHARLSPNNRLELDVSIDFEDRLIGKQSLRYSHNKDAFKTKLADARTFCMLKDVETMRTNGLARGGSLDNAVVVHEGAVLNGGGLRSDDEFVRHKALDCLGDLYLLGMAIRAKLTTSCPGHALSIELLRAVMAQPNSFVIENKAEVSHSWAGTWTYPETAVAAHS
tara:strand:+ start:651 stop:1595 length:945 start_codon:yes stop_codon:yes gene_type:complete